LVDDEFQCASVKMLGVISSNVAAMLPKHTGVAYYKTHTVRDATTAAAALVCNCFSTYMPILSI